MYIIYKDTRSCTSQRTGYVFIKETNQLLCLGKMLLFMVRTIRET
jgi:hypothetical protein